MLILSRKIGEKIIIGDDITLTIFGVRGSQVRVGVNAPIEVPINREEIHQRIQTKNKLNSTNTEDTATNITETR